ncbi:hypothetical protein A3A46_01215 [Candidatus Roizmanbacteria bacterium RIFCSPLOWO2_01_FULL_37_13]|uniref:CMP/dCMP-type deaminase domain-containing protein n=1 Tax=Candidatus Roizmanbacteria bacterium RIFCSPHIGHO2_02_FULL_38_11 TaxID=1802039 RepID=A0A1F7GVQ9_9BACT|nr:MAG: hypothetical protein A3C25_03800 [Candidatus Roizmanbacteria bacterium RIFCSPHIGHO2_02_FULL_38_11]OGK41560.1 MAG: hypothetical protein A3A46_01215 [Candidatus Roizmanbacteria bacterium RIFCSPLOWO2_01_FULL_37_13]
MTSEEEIMKQLIDYAHEKIEKNNAYPFCAFIVKNGVIISRGYNLRVNAYGDKTMHGEMEAIKKACKSLHAGVFLKGYSLYSTCEPCLACFDSALWSGINKFIFSVSHVDYPNYFNDHPYHIEDYEKDNPDEITVIRDILRQKGKELFKKAKQKYGW